MNWNGLEHLPGCLDSIAAQSFRDFDVIVVDNGSADGSLEWLRRQRDDRVKVVSLPDNRGFAGGCNAGMQGSGGRYVVLLNNDTVVDPGWLRALSGAIERHVDAGMFTPKILNYHRRDEIDNVGHLIYPDGLARGHHRLEKDDGRFDGEREALYPSGCAGVYRREMLDEIGLLDESFFAYCEDVDLGLRARWAGWTCWYVPEAVVYHKYSASSGAYSPQKAFLVERNRFWTLLKNFPLREILVSPLWTLFRYALQVYGTVTGQGASAEMARQFSVGQMLGAVVRAYGGAVAGIPRILDERRRQLAHRRIAVSEFRALLKRFRLSAVEVALKE
ncbi:MAG: glycosyltransferase family 2 protein [Deltaproteobacteria bacterium]|nr:glycosyltransferase family 2 protein [Deltaproteobacteria bacterium]